MSACVVESSDIDLEQSTAQLAAGHARKAPMPVLFDSDMDFDDTAALAYLAQEHKLGRIELQAVTVTNNAGGLPGRGLLHARCLLSRFGLNDIPVADGAPDGANAFPAWVRALVDQIVSDTLADCTLDPEPAEISAAELISRTIARTQRPLTVLVTGSLTNLAEAFHELDSRTLATHLAGVITMGGAVHVPGELLEPDPRFDGTQTVNYWVDPQGAQEVFNLVPIGRLTMVPHDATQFVPITFPFLDRLAASANTAEARYVSAMMSHPFAQAGLQAGQPAFWWDPLAAVALSKQGRRIIDYEWTRIDMIEDGPSAGRTMPVGSRAPGTWIRVAVFADQADFETKFLESLNGS
jgi:inosine-uridine nucleoside N-ribohydrolase